MSDTDPTPTTPVTIKDAMSWFRGDVAAKLISIEAKLDTLTTLLSTGGGIESAPIVTAINSMSGGKSLLDVYNAVNGMADGITLSDLHGLITNINNAVGGYPQSSLELGTVRGFLSAIMNSVGKYGILPDGTMGSASTGTLTSAGRRYIVWSALSGITLSEDGRELTPDTSWAGYEVYIQTDAPSFTLHDVTEPAQTVDEADVNSWIALSGTHTLSMSVDSQYQVRGYMRVPVSNTVIVTSELYSPSGGSYRHGIEWPSVIARSNRDASNNPYLDSNAEPFYIWSAQSLLGYRIRLISGTANYQVGIPPAQSGALTSDWTEITVSNSYAAIYSLDVPGATFIVEIEIP